MRWLKRRAMFFVHVFKILRAMFVLWLLRKLTYEETLPLITYGSFVAEQGDITVVNEPNSTRNEIGEIQKSGPGWVHMRIFRRPK